MPDIIMAPAKAHGSAKQSRRALRDIRYGRFPWKSAWSRKRSL